MRELAVLALLAAGDGDGSAPDPALLEFLGAFEDAAGEWMDPLLLDAPLPMSDEAPEQDEEGHGKRDGETGPDTAAADPDGSR